MGQPVNMKVLIVLPALLSSCFCSPDADVLYGAYGYQEAGPSALGYPYAYAQGNSVAYRAAPLPLVRSAPVVARPAVRVAPVVAKAAPVPVAAVRAAPVVAATVATVNAAPIPAVPVVKAAVPSQTSSQFHAQDELGNYSYGYDNPNSAISVSVNSDSVVTGSYVNKAHGSAVNFVSDAYGFRQI